MEEGVVFGGVPQSPNQCIKFVPARWASTGRPFLRFAA